MAVVLVDVIFFVLLLALGMMWQTISTSGFDGCYSFNTSIETWHKSNQYCQQNGGKLVSMETEEEYQFINKTIQSLDVGKDEWYIGLTRKRGDWKWISGQSYTMTNKWLPGRPDGNVNCVKMIKHYKGLGKLDDIRCTSQHTFICEYQTEIPSTKMTVEKEKVIVKCNPNQYNISGDENKTHTSSTGPTTNIEKSSNVIERFTNTLAHGLKPVTSISTNTSTVLSSTTKSFRKEQPSPIMVVVIVLAVLLAVCICSFVGVFCWFMKKSGRELKGAKSVGNPLKRRSPTRSLGKDQSNINNVNSEGENKAFFLVPVDDIDSPRLTTHTGMHQTDLSTYADVHDAIPMTNMRSKYYDDNDIYLNPVDTAPTLNAQFYESADLKPLQDVETKYEREHQLEETVGGRSSREEQSLEVDTVDPALCNNLYATTDLSVSDKVFRKASVKQEAYQECKKDSTNKSPTTVGRDAQGEHAYCNSLYATTDLSKPNLVVKVSKQDQEQKYRKEGAIAHPLCCDNLYATTDLDSEVYEDELMRAQSFNASTTGPSFSNTLYASTALIYLQDKPTEKGLEQDGIKRGKDDKPRDGKTKIGDNAKKKSRHPSIDSIMSASRKTKDKQSIPSPYKKATGDTIMYAMVDLLNNDEEAHTVCAGGKKKQRK